LLFAESAVNTSGNPQPAGAAGVEDSDKKQGISARSQGPEVTAKLRIPVRVQVHARGVVGGLSTIPGVAHQSARNLCDGPTRTAELGSIDNKLLDIESAAPVARLRRAVLKQLAAAYKQINAPVGQFGLGTPAISNTAITSGDAIDDSTYTQLEGNLQTLNAQRNSLAGQMISILEGAAFNGQTNRFVDGEQSDPRGKSITTASPVAELRVKPEALPPASIPHGG